MLSYRQAKLNYVLNDATEGSFDFGGGLFLDFGGGDVVESSAIIIPIISSRLCFSEITFAEMRPGLAV